MQRRENQEDEKRDRESGVLSHMKWIRGSNQSARIRRLPYAEVPFLGLRQPFDRRVATPVTAFGSISALEPSPGFRLIGSPWLGGVSRVVLVTPFNRDPFVIPF